MCERVSADLSCKAPLEVQKLKKSIQMQSIYHPSLLTKAELNEVLEDEEEQTPAITPTAPKTSVTSHSTPAVSSGAAGMESLLFERIEMYKTAISNAKAAGETSKVRRYDRGFKVKFKKRKVKCLMQPHYKWTPLLYLYSNPLKYPNDLLKMNVRLNIVLLF